VLCACDFRHKGRMLLPQSEVVLAQMEDFGAGGILSPHKEDLVLADRHVELDRHVWVVLGKCSH